MRFRFRSNKKRAVSRSVIGISSHDLKEMNNHGKLAVNSSKDILFMKKAILMAITVASAFMAQAQDTIVVNVYRNEPVIIGGAATPAVVYNEPVIYNGPVYYNTPVAYNAGVTYYDTVESLTAASYLSACNGSIYNYYPTFRVCGYYNPNMIRFGAIQAHRQGYHFTHRR
jgi:hypothetical protein